MNYRPPNEFQIAKEAYHIVALQSPAPAPAPYSHYLFSLSISVCAVNYIYIIGIYSNNCGSGKCVEVQGNYNCGGIGSPVPPTGLGKWSHPKMSVC